MNQSFKETKKDKTEWKIIKTDAKMRCHTGIASVTLFNTIFTLTKPYISHHILERTKTCYANFEKNSKGKNDNIIKPS